MPEPFVQRRDSQPATAPAPAPGLRLNVTSDPANLADVRRACESFCMACGLDCCAAGEVGLCVNEAMANVTRHAYGGAHDRPVAVTGWFDGKAVHVSIRDRGNGVVPPSRDKYDPLTPGGLGLVCLRRMLDGVVYTPQPDGMLVTLTKFRKSRGCCG